MKSKTKDAGDTSAASGGTSKSPSKAQVAAQVVKARNLVAQVVWLVCVIAALVLAIAALLFAVKANDGNDLVKFVKDFADDIDLGVFDLSSGIKQFHGHNALIKTALLNYGVGAIVYLIIGRILERIIKP